MIKRGNSCKIHVLVKCSLPKLHYLYKTGTQSRRGRKPAPCLSSALVKEESDVAKTILSSTTPIRKTRAAFRGKLSHTSPTLNSLPRENKITVYFGAKNGDTSDSNCVAEEDNGAEITKSIALKMVFCKSEYSFKYYIDNSVDSSSIFSRFVATRFFAFTSTYDEEVF